MNSNNSSTAEATAVLVPNEPFTVGEADVGGHGAVAQAVGDHLQHEQNKNIAQSTRQVTIVYLYAVASPHGHTGVSGAEIDANAEPPPFIFPTHLHNIRQHVLNIDTITSLFPLSPTFAPVLQPRSSQGLYPQQPFRSPRYQSVPRRL